MYNKILFSIDGSKPADKALDHAIDLIKSVSNEYKNKNIGTQLTILFVIQNLPAPLGFEKPMHSLKTRETISLSDYINEA